MATITAHKNAVEIAQASARVDDWDTDDSTDDTIWKATQVLTTQPNDIEHRDDVVRALHGLKASLGERWQELTPLVHSWLQQDNRNDERWCHSHWDKLKPNGEATIGTFFQVACVDRGRRVPMMPYEAVDPVMSNWFYLGATDRMFNAKDGRSVSVTAFIRKQKQEAFDAIIARPEDTYLATYRPDLHKGNGDPIVVDDNGVELVNCYQPPEFMANPAHLETAEWKVIQRHFFKVLLDDTDANHVLDWCAHVVQKPGHKIHWAPLVYGVQGTGKSSLFEITRAAVGGRNCSSINSATLKDKFNGFPFENVLCGIEEVKIGWGKYDLMDVLKELITAPEISQRKMHEERTKGTNVSNFMFFSNHDDALALSEGDRRYMVCQGRHDHVGDLLADGMDDAYFDELHRIVKEQPEIIYSGLMLRDISQFRPHGRAPVTKALKAMATAAMPKDAHDLQDTIEELAYDDWLNPEIVPVCLVTERQKLNTGCAVSGQALKRAFAHLGYQMWKPLDGRGRQKVDGTATNLYVKRQYATYQWQKLKELMPKK
jgi:hypothetical protein